MNNGKLLSLDLMQTYYLEGVSLYHTTKNKMATQIPKDYGPREAKRFFDGN